MRNRLLIPCVLCLALGSAARGADEPRTVREGAWFRVVCHFEHDRASDDALAGVEALGLGHLLLPIEGLAVDEERSETARQRAGGVRVRGSGVGVKRSRSASRPRCSRKWLMRGRGRGDGSPGRDHGVRVRELGIVHTTHDAVRETELPLRQGSRRASWAPLRVGSYGGRRQVSTYVSEEEAVRLRQAMRNHRRIKRLLRRWERESVRAMKAEIVLGADEVAT